jgi:hypothetical protein
VNLFPENLWNVKLHGLKDGEMKKLDPMTRIKFGLFLLEKIVDRFHAACLARYAFNYIQRKNLPIFSEITVESHPEFLTKIRGWTPDERLLFFKQTRVDAGVALKYGVDLNQTTARMEELVAEVEQVRSYSKIFILFLFWLTLENERQALENERLVKQVQQLTFE